MAKKKSTGSDTPLKLRPDVAETAYRVFQEAVGERPKTKPPAGRTEKNPEAVERGAKGGRKGGAARAKKLSPEQRSAIASKGGKARREG